MCISLSARYQTAAAPPPPLLPQRRYSQSALTPGPRPAPCSPLRTMRTDRPAGPFPLVTRSFSAYANGVAPACPSCGCCAHHSSRPGRGAHGRRGAACGELARGWRGGGRARLRACFRAPRGLGGLSAPPPASAPLATAGPGGGCGSEVGPGDGPAGAGGTRSSSQEGPKEGLVQRVGPTTRRRGSQDVCRTRSPSLVGPASSPPAPRHQEPARPGGAPSLVQHLLQAASLSPAPSLARP